MNKRAILEHAAVIAAEVMTTRHPSNLAAAVVGEMLIIMAQDQGSEAARRWLRKAADTMPEI